MAFIEGPSGNIEEITTNFKAGRVAIYPKDALSWVSFSARAAHSAGIASGTLFSFRNISANPILVNRVGIGYITTTAFTTPQIVDFSLFIARAFSASDTGGTAIALTGNNGKVRTSLATLTSVDCRITSGALLTAGTRTLDTNALATVGWFSNGVGTGVTPAINNLYAASDGDYEIILAQNEGFVINNATAFGAVGVGSIYVNVELAELSSY
jgi:hypothetical protein